MGESFTVRVVTPGGCTREHYNTSIIGYEAGPSGFITLKNPDGDTIAFYKDAAYSAWHVVQDKPTGKNADPRDEFPRDHLGRFVKRKDSA